MFKAFRRPMLTVMSVITLLVLSVGSASAHADFKSSVPAADSTVATMPAQVTVSFENHDALQADGSILKVSDAAGNVVDMGDTTLDKADPDRKTLAVSLKSGLGNGTYTVNWTAVSSGDGSKAEGNFKFSVGQATAAAPQQLPRTGGADTLLAALPVGVLLLGLGLVLRLRTARGAR